MEDLSALNDAVLVTRGPISSWCAQFYLESLSLKGLAMIDPILLENVGETETKAIRKLKEYSDQSFASKKVVAWDKLLQGAQERNLLLEPGVIPMIVMHSYDDPVCKISATHVAQRHSGGDDSRFGDVPVRPIPFDNTKDLMTEIDKWIESIL